MSDNIFITRLNNLIGNINYDKDIDKYIYSLFDIKRLRERFVMFNYTFMVYNLYKKTVDYSHENFCDVLGYKCHKIKYPDMKFLLECIEPNEQDHVVNLITKSLDEFLSMKMPERKSNYLYITLKLINEKGEYHSFVVKFYPYITDKENNIVYIYIDFSHQPIPISKTEAFISNANFDDHKIYVNDKKENNLLVTPTEMEVLYLFSLGKTCKEIAGNSFKSISTVENQRKSLFHKLNVKNYVQLINEARDLNLLEI